MTLVTLDAIQEAARLIRGVARLTPLVEAFEPPAPPLRLKCENLQLGGAFKIRGALTMIDKLDATARRGVITYSSGNHGRAVALAASLRRLPAVVVMPTTASPLKLAAVRALGAEVLLEGVTSIERKARADAEAGERGLTMIPPFDHEWIIAGQGTVGLEIAAQCADVDLVDVYVPTGGGGLLSGVATAIKVLRPSVRVIGVEPVGAAKMSASLRAGHPVTLPGTHSIADGLLPVRPGDLTFAHVRAFVDEVVTVGEDELASATGWLFREAKLVAEPSGAAAVAAVHRARQSGRARGTAVAVISGGNISVSDLVRLIE